MTLIIWMYFKLSMSYQEFLKHLCIELAGIRRYFFLFFRTHDLDMKEDSEDIKR